MLSIFFNNKTVLGKRDHWIMVFKGDTPGSAYWQNLTSIVISSVQWVPSFHVFCRPGADRAQHTEVCSVWPSRIATRRSSGASPMPHWVPCLRRKISSYCWNSDVPYNNCGWFLRFEEWGLGKWGLGILAECSLFLSLGKMEIWVWLTPGHMGPLGELQAIGVPSWFWEREQKSRASSCIEPTSSPT